VAEQLYTSVAALADTPSGSPDTTLAGNGGGITDSAASFLLASVPTGLSTSQGFVARIGSELIHCASISTLTVTVASSGRGYDGSTAAPHTDGDEVFIVWSGAGVDAWFASKAITDLNGGNWKVLYTDADGDVTEVALGAAGTAFVSAGASSVPAFALPTLPYIHIRDEQAQNTAGGTFTSGAWRTRVLNTEVTDTGGNCALASNHFTLAAGTYRIRAHAPAYTVNNHQLRIQNVTDGTTILVGTSVAAAVTGPGIVTTAQVEGRFTVAASKALELQHQCTTTSATFGFGAPANFTTEVFAVVELWREA
jgi:hypothetical protein